MEVSGQVAIHVDDFLLGGREGEQWSKFLEYIQGELGFGDKVESGGDKGGLRFTGTYIVQSDWAIDVNQTKYVGGLSLLPVDSKWPADQELGDQAQAGFRSLVMASAWATQRSRPDEAFDVNRLTGKCAKATVGDARDLNGIIKRLQARSEVQIRYRRHAKDLTGLRILVVSDASEKFQSGGYFIWIAEDADSCEKRVKAWLVGWKSWKLKRVAYSSMAAEAQAMLVAGNAARWVRKVVSFAYNVRMDIDLRTDCNSNVENLTTVHQVDDPRLAVQLASLKQDLERGVYRSVKHVDGVYNYADGLTKSKEGSRLRIIDMMMSGEVDRLY